MWSVWSVFWDCDFHSVCPLMDKDKRLMEAYGRHWLREKLGLVLMGRAMLSKSLIQFSVDGWGCVLSLLFDLRPNYGGGNEENGDFIQKVLCRHCSTQCPWPCSRPSQIHASTGDSWTLYTWHHQMVNTKIRLIIFFAGKGGQAPYSQQEQDQELTVA